MIYLYQIIFFALTYFICAIPFGLVLAKIFGKADIRQSGSGNIGATNAARVLGKKFGLATLILDGSKGAAMVIFARYLFADTQYLNIFLAIVGAIAVLAHIFPVYLNFKGGKGVATSFAVLLVINPIIGLITCLSWVILFAFTKTSAISSLSSILITVAFTFYSHAPLEEILLSILLAILIFIRHRENISRILNGEEHQFKKSDDK